MAAGNDSYCRVFNVGITERVPRADAPGPTEPELVNIELKVKFIDMERYGCPEDGVFAERGRKHSQVIHYYDPEYLINNTNGVVLEILNYQRVPLEPTVIEAIADCAKMLEEEAAEYLETEVVVESGEICSICLGELAVGSEAACMPCSHMFHRSCILPWLTKVQSCPYCRFDLNEL
ncbi:Zinc finger, RING-type [Corchorus olitorius]|uniref:RING-type E3 ubiquitin transferase n=1 Tax=Corchorus olitorius TaxID=93759 RepID=A0A1R3H358_9ROSI|nr:Zinc finger, RING-type [Corchorus olitorius]